MSNIIAIDLAINKTGVSFFREGVLIPEELRLVTTETFKNCDKDKVIRVPFSDDKIILYDYIRRGLGDRIKELQTKYDTIDKVLIEDFAFGARGASLFDMGMLNGIVRSDIMHLGLSLKVISPSEIKKHITGVGNAQKTLVALSVYQIYGLDLIPVFGRGAEDVYDSIALGCTYLNIGKKKNEQNKKKKENRAKGS